MAEQHVRHDDGVVGQVDGHGGPALRRADDVRAAARAARTSRATTSPWSGVPFDSGVTYRPGARFGPAHIRQASRLLRPYNPALDAEPFARRRRSSTPATSPATRSTSTRRSTRSQTGLRALIDRTPRRCVTPRRRPHHRPARAPRVHRGARSAWRWCTSTPTSTPGTPTSTRRTRTARRSGGRPRRACIVKGTLAPTSASAARCTTASDLLDDADARASRSCTAATSTGSASTASSNGCCERVGDAPGVRLHRHRRARPGLRPGHRHPRGRRDDQPRAAARCCGR